MLVGSGVDVAVGGMGVGVGETAVFVTVGSGVSVAGAGVAVGGKGIITSKSPSSGTYPGVASNAFLSSSACSITSTDKGAKTGKLVSTP
ncbi:MAG: hypothetical protein DWQ04_31775 [Chloroflexi bacterium]|nr:MAG: hypothetical protein DWQ04_31775 [Chloroflexota bacterium]